MLCRIQTIVQNQIFLSVRFFRTWCNSFLRWIWKRIQCRSYHIRLHPYTYVRNMSLFGPEKRWEPWALPWTRSWSHGLGRCWFMRAYLGKSSFPYRSPGWDKNRPSVLEYAILILHLHARSYCEQYACVSSGLGKRSRPPRLALHAWLPGHTEWF